ncbi:MAG: hypothetical protein J0M15_01975 [Deltaproteobacteria bacterium]|nr:hypothetical protein [Deltaproteobacteria bacterium]
MSISPEEIQTITLAIKVLAGLALIAVSIFCSGWIEKKFSFVYRSNGDDAIPEPESWRYFGVRVLVDSVLVLFGLFLIYSGHQIPCSFLTTIDKDLVSTLFQSIAGILAITVSGLLLVTQLSSEKYSSVTVHRFQSHGTIHSILRIQIIALISSGYSLLTIQNVNDHTIFSANIMAASLLFGALSILALPPLLSITILQLRPRGLIKWSALLAKEQIKTLPTYSSKKNKSRLRWEMVVLHECLQSLRFIGVSATKDQDDEIVERVLGAFRDILEFYFLTISDYRGGSSVERSFRTLWDTTLAERFVFNYDLTSALGESENQDSKWLYWIENNILRSVASMLEASVQTGGESNQKIRLFYESWSDLMKNRGANTQVEYPLILQMVCSDLLVTYRSCLTDSIESQSELLDFFHGRIEKILSICFPESAEEIPRERQVRQVTKFLKQVGELVIRTQGGHPLQKWLFIIDRLRNSLKQKDSGNLVGIIIEESFARSYFDLFLFALLSKKHDSAKIILQYICFNEPIQFIEQVFAQSAKVMNSAFSGEGRAPDNTYVRYDKYMYSVSKTLLLIVVYRRYLEDQSLVDDKLNWQKCLATFKTVDCFNDIRSKSLPHLKTEILHYSNDRLELCPEKSFDSYIDEAWSVLC